MSRRSLQWGPAVNAGIGMACQALAALAARDGVLQWGPAVNAGIGVDDRRAGGSMKTLQWGPAVNAGIGASSAAASLS